MNECDEYRGTQGAKAAQKRGIYTRWEGRGFPEG